MLLIPLIGITQYIANYKFSVVYHYSLFLLNDFLIRKYAGGTHDLEGDDWIYMFSFMGFIVLMLLTFIFFRLNKSQTHKQKLIYFLSCVFATIAIYSQFLNKYGVDTYYH